MSNNGTDFKIPSAEQWQEAFAVAKEVLARAPWKSCPEELIFMLRSEEDGEALYATVHGYEEEVKGITFHRGKEEIRKYINILDYGEVDGLNAIIPNQNGIAVQLCRGSLLAPFDELAFRKAGFTPEDEESYIVFRKYQPGVVPSFVESDDMNVLVDGLRLFSEGMKALPAAIPRGKALVALGEGGAPVIGELPEDFYEVLPEVVKDDFYVARLKKLKRTGRLIEVEKCYLPNVIQGPMGSLGYFPQICIIADVDDGSIADQCLLERDVDEEQAFFAFLSEYFHGAGLPRKIRIHGRHTGRYLRELCSRLRIELEEGEELPIIDDFFETISGVLPIE